MNRTKCFWMEPLDPPRERAWLRRYASGSKCTNPENHGYHNARALVGDVSAHYKELEGEQAKHRLLICDMAKPPQDDPRWPSKCSCGYAFVPEDTWQLFTHLLYKRTDTGEILTLEEAPGGAMWNAKWLESSAWCSGPDGRSIVAKLPDGHEWIVDGRASNCTKPEDNVHKCWVRHGEPPNLTVDKNGNTCAAGAGSILSPRAGNWHGFLRNGYLERC